MERAAAELFSAADTVPGVRCRCSAIVLRVTRSGLRAPGLPLLGVVIGSASTSLPLHLCGPYSELSSRFALFPFESMSCGPSRASGPPPTAALGSCAIEHHADSPAEGRSYMPRRITLFFFG